ncbi:MAG: PKD domain-containing protein [Ferruginibacter sp.]
MRKNLLLGLLWSTLICYSGFSQTHTAISLSQTITGANSKGFYRYLPADYDSTTKNYPLIIWVHGAGQIGQGTQTDLQLILQWGVPKIISEGGWPSSFTVDGNSYSFIVLSPQFMGWPSAANISAILNYASTNYRVDPERIYLMGISAGGGGIWDYASASVANSDKIAAMIPFCGTLAPTQTLAGRIAASNLPVWAFHNTYDGTVPVAYSRNWINYINTYVPAPTPAAKLTEFPTQSNDAVTAHECWSLATLPSYKPQGINIYEWMLQYKRRTAVVNAAPVSRAGADTSVVLPATITLNGSASTDADGVIISYRWRKLSGPSGFTLADSTAAVTQLSNLAAGTYEFELKVTDNIGATATDNIIINAFAVGAGTSQRVLIDVGTVLTTSPSNGLYWNNLTDGRPGVRVSNAITTQNLPSGINIEIINRTDGTYSTGSNGIATGNTTGAVGDYPANATSDLALVHSSGSGLWRVSGMDASKIYNIKFWGSRTNTTSARAIEIKRSDETTWQTYNALQNTSFSNAAVFVVSGKTSMDFNIRTKAGSDFSAICVLDISYAAAGNTEPQPNQPPVANAGSNVTIQLPVDSLLLNGCASSDPENGTLTYKWTKLSGPVSYELVNDAACQTRLRGLVAGTYQFELAVTDTGSLSSKDTIDITVQPALSPWPPVYTALCSDAYKIVVFGSSTAYGTGASPIDSSWVRKFAQYIGMQNAQASVVNLAVGGINSYHVMPTGYTPPANRPFPVDSTHNITKALQQNPKAIIINLPSNDISQGVPVAEVKANFEYIVSKADSARVPVWVTTTQPRNSLSTSEKAMQVELRDWIIQRFGNKAVDFWTNIADSDNNIAAVYSAGDGIHVNNAGHHIFFSRMVEEKIWDSICLRRNLPPVAVAGPDVNITGNGATINLNGAASYDPEGSALAYQWSIASGTGGSFSSSTIASPVFTASGTGSFIIVLKVTDDNALSATDTVLINIIAPNVLPVANAGVDIIQNIPPNSVQLNGSGTDTDGSITQYKWRKISGPSLVFSNDSIAGPVISSLVSGVYNLELTVTDNRGDVAKDSVLVTANAAPVANAGSDISITGTSASVQLSGAASSDPENAALVFEWNIIEGTGGTLTGSNTVSPTFSSSSEGVYRIGLKVTDPYGAFGRDTLQITIAAANIAPVANAGADQLIHLPTVSTVLIGSASYDPDGSIAAYAWRKISGPAANFSSTAIANPTLSGLAYGTYQLELTVTDNKGATAKDSMLLIVNALPVANAGSNTSITLPTSTVTLSGAASSDADGTIVSYSWQKVAGGSVSIATAGAAQTTISFTTAGNYTFELTVTDNRGASSKDSVDVTVLPVPAVTTKNIRVNVYGGTNPYNNSQWNNWNVAGALTSAKFNYEDGTASNVNANITDYGLIADNGATYASTATACPPAVLRYTSAATSYRTLTFYGMTNTKTYNLEFYGSRSNTGNKTVFQVGTAYDTISTDNNLNDVARFTGIVPDNNGRITVTLTRIGTWHYLSGFTITEVSGTGSTARASVEPVAAAAGTALQEVVAETPAALSVRPNPAKETAWLYIPSTISGAYRLTIVNMYGQVVLQKTGIKPAGTYSTAVDIHALNKGMYIVNIIINGKLLSSQLVKQ